MFLRSYVVTLIFNHLMGQMQVLINIAKLSTSAEAGFRKLLNIFLWGHFIKLRIGYKMA